MIHLIDVILIAPSEYRYVKAFSASEYLGLEYIAAFLRQHGYKVLMLNCNLNMTAQKAAEIAKQARVKKLILTHLSNRYDKNPDKVLKEARKIFKNSSLAKDLEVIEIK